MSTEKKQYGKNTTSLVVLGFLFLLRK